MNQTDTTEQEVLPESKLKVGGRVGGYQEVVFQVYGFYPDPKKSCKTGM